MGKGSMDLFLQTINLGMDRLESIGGNFLVLYAEVGPVMYVWDGLNICAGGLAI